ncbi:MAG: DUF3810 domain-containing protein [Lachnospiraceae bacterium]|nr:DUF3810 domain-containing protein [Lachnospiraceae bacterium]
MKGLYKSSIIRFVLSAVLLGLTGILWLLVKNYPDFFFPEYRTASRMLMKGISVLTGWLPFSLWDIGAVLLMLAALITLIVTIVRIVKLTPGVGTRLRTFLTWISRWILIVSYLASFAVSGWMLNHYAPRLSADLGLEIRKYSEEELYRATKYYMDKAAEYAVLQGRDRTGALVRLEFDTIAKEAGKSYERLSERFSVFSGGSTVRAKRLSLTGTFYLQRGIAGIFMPLTGESSIPEMDAIADIPYTMAHECAHRLGIASEEECNFAAFLACEDSEDLYFLYSGYYSAYIYCHNKLLREDKSWNEQLMAGAVGEGYDLLFADARASSAWYKSYEKEKPTEKMTKTNDTYLKTFSQEEGVKSYGEVVNDLIAWYLLKEA